MTEDINNNLVMHIKPE